MILILSIFEITVWFHLNDLNFWRGIDMRGYDVVPRSCKQSLSQCYRPAASLGILSFKCVLPITVHFTFSYWLQQFVGCRSTFVYELKLMYVYQWSHIQFSCRIKENILLSKTKWGCVFYLLVGNVQQKFLFGYLIKCLAKITVLAVFFTILWRINYLTAFWTFLLELQQTIFQLLYY